MLYIDTVISIKNIYVDVYLCIPPKHIVNTKVQLNGCFHIGPVIYPNSEIIVEDACNETRQL